MSKKELRNFKDEFNIHEIVKTIRSHDMGLRKMISTRYWDVMSQYVVGDTENIPEAVLDFLRFEYEEKNPGYSLSCLIEGCMDVFYTFRLNNIHSLRLQDGVWFKLYNRNAPMIAYLLTGCEIGSAIFSTEDNTSKFLFKYPSVDVSDIEGAYEMYLDDLQDAIFDWIVDYYSVHSIKCKDGDFQYTKGNLEDVLQWSAYFGHCKSILLKWLVAMGTNQDKQDNLHAVKIPYYACDRFAMVHFMHEMKDQLDLRVFDSTSASYLWFDAVSAYEEAFPEVDFSNSLGDVCFPKDLICLDRNKSCVDLESSDCALVNSDFLYLVGKDASPSVQQGFDNMVESNCYREL